MGQFPDGDESGESEIEITANHTLGEAFRTPAFWFIVAGLFLANAAITTISMYSVMYLTDTLLHSSLSIRIAGGFLEGFSIVGLLAFGVLADRWGPRKAFVLSAVMIAIGIAILASPSPFWILALYVIPYGLARNAPSVLAPMIVADCYGLPNFGFIYAVIGLLASLGTALFTFMGGFIFDYTYTYQPTFAITIILALLSGYCMYMAKPKNQEESNHI
jgi:MFS family permease